MPRLHFTGSSPTVKQKSKASKKVTNNTPIQTLKLGKEAFVSDSITVYQTNLERIVHLLKSNAEIVPQKFLRNYVFIDPPSGTSGKIAQCPVSKLYYDANAIPTKPYISKLINLNIKGYFDTSHFITDKGMRGIVNQMPVIRLGNSPSAASMPIHPEVLKELILEYQESSKDELKIVEFIGTGTFGHNTPVNLAATEYSDYYKFHNRVMSFQNKYQYDDYEIALGKPELLYYGVISPTFKSTLGMKYTYGVEIECSQSMFPPPATYAFNMSCTRDGSLNGGKGGPEYVTGVLNGDCGMMHLQKILNFLSMRSQIDKYCGVHIHIGGFTPSKEFAVAMFLASYNIQNSLFTLLPHSRRSNEYCRVIPNAPVYKLVKIKEDILKRAKSDTISNSLYNTIVSEMHDYLLEYVGAIDLLNISSSQNMQKQRMLTKSQHHPHGRKANYNHKTPRYEWINLVPLLFNEKGSDVYTVEFRPHQASLNFLKIKNWILLCMLFTNFVEQNRKQIILDPLKSLTYTDLIKSSDLSDIAKFMLLKYCNDRATLYADKAAEAIESSEESFNLHTDKSLKEICV